MFTLFEISTLICLLDNLEKIVKFGKLTNSENFFQSKKLKFSRKNLQILELLQNLQILTL